MSYTSRQFMINAKPGIPQAMFISTYLVINHIMSGQATAIFVGEGSSTIPANN
jgi:hypothetical protein